MDTTSRRTFLSRLVFGRDPAVANPGERALVCIFLRGAADTLNMLIPYGDREYYVNRPALSIAAPTASGLNKDAAVRLDDYFGFHPKMAPLVPIFREGRLGVVQAVGSDNPTGSHFEAAKASGAVGSGATSAPASAMRPAHCRASPSARRFPNPCAARPPPARFIRLKTFTSPNRPAARKSSRGPSRRCTGHRSGYSGAKAGRHLICSSASRRCEINRINPWPARITPPMNSAKACAKPHG